MEQTYLHRIKRMTHILLYTVYSYKCVIYEFDLIEAKCQMDSGLIPSEDVDVSVARIYLEDLYKESLNWIQLGIDEQLMLNVAQMAGPIMDNRINLSTLIQPR